MNLAALLFDVARRLPEQPAVSDDRQSWNYRELARRIAGVAGAVDTLDAVISTRTAEYDALVTTSEPMHPETGGAANSAWLFYTSGTTGRPKGAVLTDRNLLFMSQCYYADIDRLDERDTHLCAAPVSQIGRAHV